MGQLDSLLKGDLRHCPRCQGTFNLHECDIVTTWPPEKTTVLYRGASRTFISNLIARIRGNPGLHREHLKYLPHRQCPHCGYLLPSNFDNTPVLTIAIIGDFLSGKSHYIAALIKQLREERVVPDDESFTLMGMTPRVEDVYKHEYLEKLFKTHEPIERTQPRQIGDRIDPLIYEWTFRRSSQFPPMQVNIAFHDVSGQSYIDESSILAFAPHVLEANALIYLVDPITLPRLQLSFSETTSPTRQRDPAQTLDAVSTLIEQFRRLPPGSRLIDLPLAVVISKADLLKRHSPIGRWFEFSHNPFYKGGIDLIDLEKIQREVLEVIAVSGNHSLIQVVQAFEKRRFFAVSATGHASDNNNQSYSSVEPCRCLDPLLWILYEFELIRATKQ